MNKNIRTITYKLGIPDMTKSLHFHKIWVSLFLLISASLSHAQIKPDPLRTSAPNPTGTVSTPYNPGDYRMGTYVNYIREYRPQVATTDESYIISSTRTVNEVNVSTQYSDGLGRSLQKVEWQISPDKKDLIAPVVYDGFGREQYKFLPYTSPMASPAGNPGKFRLTPFSEQKTFYTTDYKTEQPALTNEKFFYGKTNLEPSPLNRVLKSFAPGNSWVGSEGAIAEKNTSMQYLVNTREDSVRIWHVEFNTSILDNTNIPYSSTSDKYDPGQLYKTVSIDEAGAVMVEYKDKDGKVILKKNQIGTIAADFSGYEGFLCTYYIYDDLGQLRTVLPPKAVAPMAVADNWLLDQPTINELCFRYEYDGRQRMIAKRVPGADWVYMVYDVRNRLVFSQDGNLRDKSQWMYLLYDDLNRSVQTGIMSYEGSWASLQNSMPGTQTAVNASGTDISVNPSDMYINNRESGRSLYQATNSITLDHGFTSENDALFTAEIITETPTTFSSNVSVNTNPIPVTGVTLYPLTYTYYDDYAATTKTYNTSNNSLLNSGTYVETLPSQNSTQTRGMVTVTRVRVIEDPNNLSAGKWLETVNFYDDKGRVIQAQNTNYKGGNDITTNSYDFTGKVLNSYTVHNNASGNITNLRVKSSMNYDHAGRLLSITKTINDDDINKRLIVTNTYDALGQLKNKKTGQKIATDGTPDDSPLEDDNYNYNIRGWLKDINWYSAGGAYASQMNMSPTVNKWFSMDLSYDWGFDNSASAYNCNISGTRWKTAGDGQERAYGFKYDTANRLLKADFTQNNGGWNTSVGINFSMQVGDGASASSAYDENGNIRSMQQYGLIGVTSGLVDKMTYKYKQSGEVSNQLLAVSEDASIDNIDHNLGDFTDKNAGLDDYDYDANGNLLYDKNKKITSIEYNHLNLPWRLTVQNDDGTGKGTITYIYDAAGNKLEKLTSETPSTYNNSVSKLTTSTYLGAFIYENNVLQFISHEEGRVRYKADDNTYVYDYFIKDHLGNVRMVLTEEQTTNLYPAATLEGTYSPTGTTQVNSMVNYEKQFYHIDDSKITAETSPLLVSWGTETEANTKLYYNNNGNPPANTKYPSGCSPTQLEGSHNLYRVNGSSNPTGLEFMIKVMAGDHIDIFGKSYYLNTATITNDNSTKLDALTLMTNLLLAPANAAGAKGISASQLSDLNPGNTLDDFFRGNNSEPATTIPKAYINYIFLDEQFKFAGGAASRVGDNSSGVIVKDHWYADEQLRNILVPKNGYIFVYVSNESKLDVFFDNLQVIHKPGPILEETHYYPFGLTMSGISSKAAGTLQNKYKYNGIEKVDALGLEDYEAKFRMLDPQLGRWWQVDPKTENMEMWSPYVSNYNNPITFSDLLGDEPEAYPIVRITKEVVGSTQQRVIGSYSGNDISTKVDLYKVEVTDTEDPNFNMTFMTTRDAFTVLPGDDQGSSVTLSNTAFEPKDGNVNHYTANEMNGGYPKGNGTTAFKLTQKGSEVMSAAPNDNAVKAGSRTKSDVASGVMMHVGGQYKHKDGATSLAASEGCFGVVNKGNSKANPSNSVSNNVLGRIINQANKSKTNPGKIEVVIDKRTQTPDKVKVDRNGNPI